MSALAAGAAASGAAGGASAGAAAGGFGSFGEALLAFGNDMGEAKKATSEFAGPLKNITDTFGSFKQILNVSFPLMTGFTESISILGKSLLPLATVLPDMTKQFIDLGKYMTDFVRLASPLHVKQFNLALDDLHAMIGRGMAPVLDQVTKLIRNVADSFGFVGKLGNAVAAGLEPFRRAMETLYEWAGRVGNGVARVAAALAPSFAAIGETLAAIAKAVEPLGDLAIDTVTGVLVTVFDDIASVLKDIVPFAIAFARAMKDLNDWIARNVRELLSLLGLSLPNESGTRAGSSVGAAARAAEIGSLESAVNKALTNAFSLGTAASPEMRTADGIRLLNEKVERIEIFLGRTIPAFIDAVLRALGKPLEATKDVIAGAVRRVDTFEARASGAVFGGGGLVAAAAAGG